MKSLLVEIKKSVDLSGTDTLTLDEIESFEKRYDEILKKGFNEDYNLNLKLYSKKSKEKY